MMKNSMSSNKIAILGDTHFGARNNSLIFHEFFDKCYNDIFFKKLEEHNIKTVIQLGDLFDQRKAINIHTLHECKRYFFDELKKRNINLIAILGNHDIYFKSSLQVNAPELLLREYENIKIIKSPEELELENCRILFVPWICDENEKLVKDAIEKSNADFMVAHLELSGFEMFKGQTASHGQNISGIGKFKKVITGHYHHQSTKGNIHYVGTFYDTTWADYDDQKGFHILDGETKETIFIENPYSIHKVIIYDENNVVKNLERYNKSILKIVVTNKIDQYKFESFIKRLEDVDIHEIKIIEQEQNESESRNHKIIIDQSAFNNTLDMMHSYIDSADEFVGAVINKDRVKKYMQTLYSHAMTGEKIG